MKANEANLLKFFQGPKQFIIPIFQRTYSWEQRHCEQLWRDVLRVGQDESTSAHFLGSIVYMEHGVYSASTVSQLLVIDGQQRLTTLSLLLSALGRAIEEQDAQIGISRRKLENYYLFNSDEDGELRYKQLLTRSDKETLIRLLEGKELSSDASPLLLGNYRFFEDRLKRVNPAVVYAGIQKLIIVDISLNRDHDNPQLIFESLNSTGLDLSQADLIRNYVLMEQEPAVQKQLYEDYWFPMEQRFGHEYTKRFDRFIRDYLTLKTRRIPNINGVYDSFKAYVRNKESSEDLEAIITDIYRYSKHYVRIALLKEEEPELLSRLGDINTLRVDVAFPFLLEVYEDYTQGQLDKAEMIEILRLIESYVFRRAICGIPTNSLNKTFATLMEEVDKSNYLESLKVTFSLAISNRRFPSDNEFQREFLIKDIYNFRSRNYLLRKLENHGRKEPINVENYTIEHVMPQNRNLSEEWQQELGENWKEIREKYLHTIGNLTLTGYNPELSDYPFKEKQSIPGGFRDSPLHLNQSLAQAEQWNETAILKRANKLAQTALQIWINADVPQEILERYKQKEAQKQEKGYTLADHPSLTGEMLELFQQLRRRIQNLDASVSEQITKLYIAYKISTVFVDVVPQAKRLRLSLNLPFPETNDPRGWCKDVTNIGRWGMGDVEVGISSPEQLDYIMSLIHQAFEKQMEAES